MTVLRELLRRPRGAVPAAWLALVLLSALVSRWWTPQDPFRADPYRQWLGPGPAHPFGTDAVGRDVLSYVLAASGTTVVVAVASAAVAVVVGVLLAALGGLTRRWLREVTVVVVDVLVAFPTILVAMALAAVFGGSLGVVVVSVGVSYGVAIGRVGRGELRRVATSDYVLAGRAAGLGGWGSLRRHVLPNAAPVLVVQVSLAMATSVLAEAGLSFLGYGASASTPSWGRLLSDLQPFLAVHPWTVAWPGLAITLTVLSLNLLGDALRDATDPRLRTSGRARRPRRPDAAPAAHPTGRTAP